MASFMNEPDDLHKEFEPFRLMLLMILSDKRVRNSVCKDFPTAKVLKFYRKQGVSYLQGGGR